MVNVWIVSYKIYNEIKILDSISLKHQTLHRRRQLSHVIDQAIGFEVGDRYLGISKFDADDRNAGAAGHADIRTGIADHDRRGHLAARARDGLPQYGRIGLRNAEGVRAANRGKPRTQSQPAEQQLRQPLQFVGANRKAISARGQIIERAFQAFERARKVGDMGRIVIDEVAGEPGDVFEVSRAALQLQAALDQPPGTRADHIARGMEGDRGQTLAVENKVERVDQVGRRIHERAVKIEYNSAGRGHRKALSVRAQSCK